MLPNVLRPSATDHVPVLAEEVREALAVRPGETVVDATFGAGGHAALLAADLRGKGKLIAIDRDPFARVYFDQFRKSTAVQARFLRGDFAVVLEQLASNGVRAHRRVRRDDMRRHPGARTLRRRPSRQAGVPGPADRGQRRARVARRGAAGGARAPAARRPPRGDQLPLARGPDRQALPPLAGAGLHLPARLSDLRLRARARAARTVTPRDPPVGAGDRDQPAGRLRPAARGRQDRVRDRHGLAMASWNDAAHALPSPRPSGRPRPAARRRPRARRGVAGGVVWIAALAGLLTGGVALNVALL